MSKRERKLNPNVQFLVRCIDLVLQRDPRGLPLEDIHNFLVSYPDKTLQSVCTDLGIKRKCRSNCHSSREAGRERLRYHLRSYHLDTGIRPFIYITPVGVKAAKKDGRESDIGRWVNAERLAYAAFAGRLSINNVIADLNRAGATLSQQGHGTLATADAVIGLAERLKAGTEIFVQPELLGDGMDQMPDLFSA